MKKVAQELLTKLEEAMKVFHWRDRQQPRSVVRSTIEVVLNSFPEDPYPQGRVGRKGGSDMAVCAVSLCHGIGGDDCDSSLASCSRWMHQPSSLLELEMTDIVSAPDDPAERLRWAKGLLRYFSSRRAARSICGCDQSHGPTDIIRELDHSAV